MVKANRDRSRTSPAYGRTMPAPFEVSIKAIIRDPSGRVLGLSRHSHKDDLFWDFPGGRLEKGEEIGDAIVRELHAELGEEVSFRPRSPLHVDTWDDPDWDGLPKVIVYYLVEGEVPEIVLSAEHEAHHLFTGADLNDGWFGGARIEESFRQVARLAMNRPRRQGDLEVVSSLPERTNEEQAAFDHGGGI